MPTYIAPKRATPVQSQILRFLDTQGPADIYTGCRTTHCVVRAAGNAVGTNTITLYKLAIYEWIEPASDDPFNRTLYRITDEGRRLIGRKGTTT